jgi:hypothetical protein
MSTLAEILTNVQNNLPTDYHSDILTTTKITEFINAAVREVCKRHNFWWMKKELTQNTTDGQQRYDLPDGTTTDANGVAVWRWKVGINVDLIDYQAHRIALNRRYKNDIETDPAYRDTSDTDIPADYCEDQDDLWLYPKPNHADNNNLAFQINAEYWGYPLDLSASNTHNKLSDGWPEALEYWATARCYRHGQDYADAEYWEGLFDKQMAIIIDEDVDRQDTGIEQGLTPTAGAQVSGSGYNDQVCSRGGYVDGT